VLGSGRSDGRRSIRRRTALNGPNVLLDTSPSIEVDTALVGWCGGDISSGGGVNRTSSFRARHDGRDGAEDTCWARQHFGVLDGSEGGLRKECKRVFAMGECGGTQIGDLANWTVTESKIPQGEHGVSDFKRKRSSPPTRMSRVEDLTNIPNHGVPFDTGVC